MHGANGNRSMAGLRVKVSDGVLPTTRSQPSLSTVLCGCWPALPPRAKYQWRTLLLGFPIFFLPRLFEYVTGSTREVRIHRARPVMLKLLWRAARDTPPLGASLTLHPKTWLINVVAVIFASPTAGFTSHSCC
mmetsp:Transcript_40096/g.110382  ORF Transcript_40096/g.110382 Transcript_40096/m.110382 type:complete len:133 (-) Transcript_40096:1675-2073(-)